MKPHLDPSSADSFHHELHRLARDTIQEESIPVGEARICQALAADCLQPEDFMALLSPAAAHYLESIARKAQKITQRQFGRVIELFTPLYLSNLCTNRCVYCGFNALHRISRQTLSLEQVEQEALAIRTSGLRSVLALTGDAPRKTGSDYLAACIEILSRHFSSVGIEVPAMSVDQYRRLIAAGASSMTLFQETYDESLYAFLHPAGPKRDFRFRLDAPQCAALAGIRSVNLGALLGLDDWRRDVFMMGMHAMYLQRRFPALALNFSLPRLRPCEGGTGEGKFKPQTVSDQNLVQALIALRCFMPQAGITISTRESPILRDRLIPLGVTRISAGVSTAVGGHAAQGNAHKSTPQFAIADDRSVMQMVRSVEQLGYQPVYSDWLLTGQELSGLTPALSACLRSGEGHAGEGENHRKY